MNRRLKWLVVICIVGVAAYGGTVLATTRDRSAGSHRDARRARSFTARSGWSRSGQARSHACEARALTARFHRVEAAIEAGYELGYVNGAGNRIITGCVAHPTAGAMGYHYFNKQLVDDLVVDELKPEALVYASRPNGKLRLVAVEWVVPGANSNPPGVSAPPTVLGHEMVILVPAVGFYTLHAWIWQYNPAGLFAHWNPNVTCP